MNNLSEREKTLGEWLKDEEIVDSEEYTTALLWPKSYEYAQSMIEDAEIDRVLTTSPTPANPTLATLDRLRQFEMKTHELKDLLNSELNLEYSWAIADDTVQSIEKENLSKEQAMNKIAQTSEEILATGGTAVYNLAHTGSRYSIPKDEELDYRQNQLEYARTFQDILEEQYAEETHIVEDPDYRETSTHLIWQKSE